jgi:hypothetical protein
MKRTLLIAIGLLLFSITATAQTYRVADMNTEQICSLHKERTAVLIPGGIIEEHGPYLPSFSDGYGNEWLTQRLAEAIAARPGWIVLIFPTVPLGIGGANEIGRKYIFPGTYVVRSTTLRAVFMDLASELGERASGGFLSCTATGHRITIECWTRRAITSATLTVGIWCI